MLDDFPLRLRQIRADGPGGQGAASFRRQGEWGDEEVGGPLPGRGPNPAIRR
ncbi:MAG: hypothetical protein M3P34_07210 [Actinomycetota bacterium]|nr:hypothetical protein [Actinomycetota bacterium]